MKVDELLVFGSVAECVDAMRKQGLTDREIVERANSAPIPDERVALLEREVDGTGH